MPKTKRPIVPVRKPVDQKQTPKEGRSQAFQRQPSKSARRPQLSRSGSSHRVGGGHGKRSREGEDPLNTPGNTGVKRRKISGVDGGSRHARDGSRGASRGQWRPLSTVHQQAAAAVQRLLEADSSRKHGASLKTLTLAPHVEAKKATFAVTCQVLKFAQVLEQLDERAGLSASQPKLGKYVAMVLSYELLRGQGLARKGPAERAVLAAEPRLREALEALLREEGAQSLDELLAERQRRLNAGGGGGGPDVPHPRWVRVNTLKADVDDVVRQLEEYLRTTGGGPRQQSGGSPPDPAAGKVGSRSKCSKNNQEQQGRSSSGGLAAVSGAPAVVVRDPLLPGELLALPAGTDLHAHPLVTRGSVVLQSKASCMPARALAPEPGWTVVDCCAAPGNKTTHLAAIIGNKGRVLAFDKDPRRLSRLRANAELTGASCIQAHLADFLTIDPTAPEFRQVRAVLLDPSCSGSGTTFTRMDHLLPSHHNHHNRHNRYNSAAAASGGQPTAGAPQQAAGAAAAGTAAATTATTATGASARASATASASAPLSWGQGDKLQRKQKNIRQRQQQHQVQKEREVAGEEAGGGSAACPVLDPGPVQDLLPDPEEAARVTQLARFQAAALSHALRFPALERLVYSTCSVHVEENEAVIAGALQQAAEAGLELADPFPSWHRRGLPLFPGAEKLIRTDAYQDGTDGFFVALFQRRRGGRQQSPPPQPLQPQPGMEQLLQEDGSAQQQSVKQRQSKKRREKK